MAAIAATSPIGAYQREATRLATTPRVGGKVVSRDATVSIGPFSVSYSAKDYEFDLSGATAQTATATSFGDALDAAATTQQLAETPSLTESTPNALTLRQALTSYAAAAAAAGSSADFSSRTSMFTAVV
jgi:hypothetical protein